MKLVRALQTCVTISLNHSLVCKLIFLPPYSPDFNPIEQAFSSVKAYIRRHWRSDSLSVIDRACQNITPEKAEGYFRASGYII
jgi:transposase